MQRFISVAAAKRQLPRAVHGLRLASTRRDAAFEGSMADPVEFWRRASEDIYWKRPFDHVLDKSRPPFYKWFVGGQTNTCYNALDRHVEGHRGDQAALIYDSAVTGTRRTYTYRELLREVETAAGMLRYHGVGKGDTVVIYMPMIPETIVSMLACARIGAVHSVVFGGFASHELAARIDDSKPKVILAGSAGMEGASKIVHYQPLLDGALESAKHKGAKVIMLNRPQAPALIRPGRELDWMEEMEVIRQKGLYADPVWVDSSHPQYIIYTSGSTGAPKGVVRDTGGHAVALQWSMANVYGMAPGEVWWAASDPAWVVGASYICYAPLLNGNATVLYEGKPVGTPDAGAFWRVCRDHSVSAMFTAPTAIRAIKKEDPHAEFIAKQGTGVLKALFLAGERSDPDTVKWAQTALKMPVIDHYWQTEFGWPVLANLRGMGLFPVKPGSAGKSVPGWDLRVLSPQAASGDDSAAGEFFASRTAEQVADPKAPHTHHAAETAERTGHRHHSRMHPAPFLPEADTNELGPLAIRLPLPPGALTGLYNNEARFLKGYTDPHPGYFETGDAAILDDEGYIHVMSRIDDVMNVAGHRLSTGAIEAAIASLQSVAECAVIGPLDELKGQIPLALIVLKANITTPHAQVIKEAIARVRQEVGPVAVFKHAVIVSRLPKTRSGKVLRATMKSIADGVPYKQPAAIEDPATLTEVATALHAIGYGVGATKTE